MGRTMALRMDGDLIMNLISYNDLARLRIRDFLPKDAAVTVEESGMQIVVGLGGFERCGETIFGWRQGQPYQTAEITVDLRPSRLAPGDLADRLASKLRLPVSRDTTPDDVLRRFSKPQLDSKSPSGRFLRFAYGEKEPYLLGFHFDNQDHLETFFIARKDYCDEDDAL
jgi:hypothetical protein